MRHNTGTMVKTDLNEAHRAVSDALLGAVSGLHGVGRKGETIRMYFDTGTHEQTVGDAVAVARAIAPDAEFDVIREDPPELSDVFPWFSEE